MSFKWVIVYFFANLYGRILFFQASVGQILFFQATFLFVRCFWWMVGECLNYFWCIYFILDQFGVAMSVVFVPRCFAYKKLWCFSLTSFHCVWSKTYCQGLYYRNLPQCTSHGLRITKIHRVLQFAQSPWLRDYIEPNTRFRTSATNDFEKNLYKLMNNAVFGKTMENVRNHVDVKLLTHWEGRYGAEAMIAKPNFHSRSVFSEKLIAVELRKLEVKFNKPIYVGMCILDISKICLYEFHHEYMSPMHGPNCKILYTDTDSLIYHIRCDDIYESMKHNIDRFDTSDYPIDNAYNMPRLNKKVPGLMKDENNGAIMTEFVGLRAKMYALRVDGKKDTKKAKGVKTNVIARTITFDDYAQCLQREIEMVRRQSCIRSKLHKVYTISESKIALSPYDDKRYIVPDSTDTLPWGHYKIPL